MYPGETVILVGSQLNSTFRERPLSLSSYSRILGYVIFTVSENVEDRFSEGTCRLWYIVIDITSSST